MTAIMFSKWVGDLLTHSIYHSLLELKCIPFLDTEPVFRSEENGGAQVSLEHYQVKHIMSTDIVTLREVENLSRIIEVLKTTEHGGFPVVSEDDKFTSIITRLISQNLTECEDINLLILN